MEPSPLQGEPTPDWLDAALDFEARSLIRDLIDRYGRFQARRELDTLFDEEVRERHQ